jgi:hypothetical protein
MSGSDFLSSIPSRFVSFAPRYQQRPSFAPFANRLLAALGLVLFTGVTTRHFHWRPQ